MHIKDTAGQEDYKAINEIFYKQANGILLVYDVTNSYSFDEIQDYYCKKIEDNCNKDIKVILLGNKSDLENERQIQPEEGATFDAKKGFMFMETSCLKNKNVADGFETLIELTYRDSTPGELKKNINLKYNDSKKDESNGCC